MIEKTQKNGVNPVATAVGGVVLGVGLAVAGVIALKDKTTQKKVDGAKQTIKSKGDELKQKISGTLKELKSQSDEIADDVSRNAVLEAKSVARKVVSQSKKN